VTWAASSKAGKGKFSSTTLRTSALRHQRSPTDLSRPLSNSYTESEIEKLGQLAVCVEFENLTLEIRLFDIVLAQRDCFQVRVASIIDSSKLP